LALGYQKVEVGSKQKVRILQACMVAGQALKVGEVYELPAEDAVAIKNLGKAEAVVDEPAPAAVEPVVEEVKKEEVVEEAQADRKRRK
jgi:hypothetical protein